MTEPVTEPTAPSSAAALPSDLACFEAGGAVWGIDVRCVRRILRGGEIRPLPGAPSFIVGVIDLGEALVPVLDLAGVLGATRLASSAAAPAQPSGDPGEARRLDAARARIVVVESGERVLGLRVGRAAEVLSLEGRRAEAAPALARDAGYDAVQALVRRDDASPVLVLALERVLDRLIRAAAPEEARS